MACLEEMFEADAFIDRDVLETKLGEAHWIERAKRRVARQGFAGIGSPANQTAKGCLSAGVAILWKSLLSMRLVEVGDLVGRVAAVVVRMSLVGESVVACLRGDAHSDSVARSQLMTILRNQVR